MRKKYLSALLFGALLFASAGTFTSCKDYDDDINNLSQRVDQIASDLADLETKVNALGCVESIEFSDGKLIVHTPNGDVSAAMPECTGIKEVKLEGNTLYVDGVEAGKVELGSGEEGQIPVITVKDGKLYVNDQLMDIEVGSNVVLVDNGDTCTITVDGQSVTLMKNAAQLTSIQFEDNITFGGIQNSTISGGGTNRIQWALATKATPNWAGEKGAVALNQLLIGQIATANVQVTPADYDLGAQKLTLVDSKGNEAPVIITAKPNNLLMKGRAASANGSWTLSATIDQTKVNEGNIATAFDWDMTSGDAMAYTLCVNGKPFTTYDFAVLPDDGKATSVNPIHINSASDFYFIDAEGRRQEGDEDIPIGTTELLIEDSYLYDYYYTFEGTNKSLAEQYGIKAEGKTITVPAEAAGVEIGITVHTMSIAGDVVPSATDPVTTNQVTLHIAGSEVAAETLAATTHQIVPGDALKEIRVDFGDVFSKFPAANREAARQSGQFEIAEANTQTGFLVEPDWQIADKMVFNNVQYFKADGSAWTASEDILDLSYMTLNVAGDVAADAKPGDYTLEFVATDADWLAGVYGNELIKVTIPVTVKAPTFEEMFDKDANWTADVYTARIYADGMAAKLRYTNAFKKTTAYADVETSHIGIVFNAIEHNQYPITGWTNEFVTDNTQAVMTNIASGVELDKNVVYNEDGNALEVRELKDMRAYYDVFDGVTGAQMGLNNTKANAVKQAFTAVSNPFTTQIQEALYGVAINYYINGTPQSNVKLNNDRTITIGSKPNSGKQGLMFELNGDDLFVTSDNFNASAADKLDIFTLYSAFNRGSWAQMTNYDVDVLFEGANGETVTWNANKALQFNITGESSTLNVTLKDATGIDYKLSVKVER